jgi:hypothetical protein
VEQFDAEYFRNLGIVLSRPQILPPVAVYDPGNASLVLIETMVARRSGNIERRRGLIGLFKAAKIRVSFIAAFPDRTEMAKHLDDIAWESAAWVADAPSHLIHFNGGELAGPYGGHVFSPDIVVG